MMSSTIHPHIRSIISGLRDSILRYLHVNGTQAFLSLRNVSLPPSVQELNPLGLPYLSPTKLQ